MSKPLELTMYPIWENGFGDFYADKEDPMRPTRVDFEVFRKRLTDTELAAEYWRAGDGMAEVNYDRDGSAEPITKILYRFATLPSYDEVAS
jgi:hypothetical protein